LPPYSSRPRLEEKEPDDQGLMGCRLAHTWNTDTSPVHRLCRARDSRLTVTRVLTVVWPPSRTGGPEIAVIAANHRTDSKRGATPADLAYTPPLGSPYDAIQTRHSHGSTPNVTDLANPAQWIERRIRANGCTLMPWATKRPNSQGPSGSNSPGQSNNCPAPTACQADLATN
jgi:hypothetical protein